MSRKNIVFIVVGILVIVAVGLWFWLKNKQTPEKTPTPGGQISETLQNPIGGKVPETNPFKNQKNPFDVIYQNPFK